MTSIIASEAQLIEQHSGGDGASASKGKVYPTNDVVFVGKGNAFPSKYIVIPKSLELDVGSFTDNFLIKGLNDTDGENTDSIEGFLPTEPGVLLSVTGGAQDFYMPANKLEQVFHRGLLKAAQNINAWIVDGGLDAGVMQFVGKAIKDVAVDDVPCIGIASHKMVIHSEMLQAKGMENSSVEYVANIENTATKCALNPNHTHFILVDSPVANWGQEIAFRANFEQYISEKYEIPVVVIVVNGGPGTLDTVAQACEKNFPIVVVQGSGRASDAVAALVTKAQLTNTPTQSTRSVMTIVDDGVDVAPWLNLLKEAKGDQKKIDTWTGYMDKILNNYRAVTVFNADDEASADMDIFILRAILSSPGEKMSLREKLRLGVVWNREDIITEILETEKDNDLSTEGKKHALNAAFELAIQKDRPKIFSILAENGAKKDAVNLGNLYYYKAVKSYFKRLPAYAQTRRINKNSMKKELEILVTSQSDKNKGPSEYSKDNVRNRTFLKEIFKHAGNAFQGYHAAFEKKFDSNTKGEDDKEIGTGTISRNKQKGFSIKEASAKVSFTDFLIWAIFVNRMELAKEIWRHTTLPVHSALLACQLYRYLSNHCSDKEGYLENADWFEDEAIKVMDILEYGDIKDVLVWEWAEMGNKTALDIAQDASCKRFIGHSHVQSLLDDSFYSDEQGKLEPTIPTWQLWACILVPFFISLIYKPSDNTPKNHFWYFYQLPITKFWTNTFLYCIFLFVQGYVLCVLNEGDNFHVTEILLWIWVGSLVIDEIAQYIKDKGNHFKYLSNWMDILLLLLHVAYMILRWISHAQPDFHDVFSASINVLIVACIISWGRLLNVFAISDSLGPLYFIIIRLFKDIFVWIFVFVIFAVSFQLGFISITKQAGQDPTEGYPEGTFPVAFFTIIGEYSYAADILKGTPLGVALLAVYALIAQILLVNLLIAMMGDTYSNVSDNSASEWKFYRLELMMENRSASFHPPPTNLIIVPIQFVYRTIFGQGQGKVSRRPGLGGYKQVGKQQEEPTNFPSTSEPRPALEFQRTLKKMRIAKDAVIDEEEQADSTAVSTIVLGVHERLRTLANERENDRTFLNKKFKDLETTLTQAANQAAASGGGGAVAGFALDKLHDTIRNLQETNQLLSQQNQTILGLLQQQQEKQAQMQAQLNALSPPPERHRGLSVSGAERARGQSVSGHGRAPLSLSRRDDVIEEEGEDSGGAVLQPQ